ncbi:MAG TPA: B12-binding domain-containing protein, partial [Ornithinimicrobium sp.]|nr:B12-binding domain-containing protein [Ornithinimicrobium sp.]
EAAVSTAGSQDRQPGAGRAIREVSELLGVPAPTLRSWELRYGVPSTGRSAGGHRRYSDEAVHELRLMRDEVARGLKASEAARAVRALLDPEDPRVARVHALLEASAALDPARIRDLLDRALEELGLPETIDRVLMPAMRQVGSFWETGRCDVAQEHLTTETARGWLSRVSSLAPPPASGRPILLACGPRDLHTLGLEALATLLVHQRRGCRVLGARTPARTLATAVGATDAAAVVVVSHLSTQRRPAVEALHAAAGTGVPVFYAGNAFVLPGARTGVPGTYLGERLAAAADLLLDQVPG